MAQSLVGVYIHLIFGTYVHNDSLPNEGLDEIHRYIGGVLNECGCVPIAVGGVESHIHVLCELSTVITIADLVKKVKTQSTKWIKETYPKSDFYKWQRGYAVMSVSKSVVHRVKKYIQNQEEHHKSESYDKEIKRWADVCELHYVDDLWCTP